LFVEKCPQSECKKKEFIFLKKRGIVNRAGVNNFEIARFIRVL
jgi:hypothetical protein